MQVSIAGNRSRLTAEVLDVLMGVGRRFRRRSAGSTIDPGAFWLLLGPDVEHRQTDYDTAAAADAIEASGHPSGAQFTGYLREPASPDEVSAHFESLRVSASQ